MYRKVALTPVRSARKDDLGRADPYYSNIDLPEWETQKPRSERVTLLGQARGEASKVLLAEDEPPQGRGARTPTKITQQLRQQVLERYAAGRSSRQVAAEFGLAKSTVLAIVRADGELRPRSAVLTPQQFARARKLRAQGLPYREIGERLGVHKDTIRRRLL